MRHFHLCTRVICDRVSTALACTFAGPLTLKQNCVFTIVTTSGCIDQHTVHSPHMDYLHPGSRAPVRDQVRLRRSRAGVEEHLSCLRCVLIDGLGSRWREACPCACRWSRHREWYRVLDGGFLLAPKVVRTTGWCFSFRGSRLALKVTRTSGRCKNSSGCRVRDASARTVVRTTGTSNFVEQVRPVIRTTERWISQLSWVRTSRQFQTCLRLEWLPDHHASGSLLQARLGFDERQQSWFDSLPVPALFAAGEVSGGVSRQQPTGRSFTS